jgi:hypothetical protein
LNSSAVGLPISFRSFGRRPSDAGEKLRGDVPQSALYRFVTAGRWALERLCTLDREEASGDAGERRVGREPHDDPGTAPGISDLQPREDPREDTGEGEFTPETGDVESRATAGDRDSRPGKLPTATSDPSR